MDTIMIIRDSVATCVNKTAEMCQPCVKGVGNSYNDVVIVGIICGAILLLAIIAVVAYFKQKSYERKALEETFSKKQDEEKENRENKKKADVDSYEQNKQDHKLKRKEELENRLHSYMESRIKGGDAISKDDMFIEDLKERINAIKVEG
jgi:uncharacterized protein YxeA